MADTDPPQSPQNNMTLTAAFLSGGCRFFVCSPVDEQKNTRRYAIENIKTALGKASFRALYILFV